MYEDSATLSVSSSTDARDFFRKRDIVSVVCFLFSFFDFFVFDFLFLFFVFVFVFEAFCGY